LCSSQAAKNEKKILYYEKVEFIPSTDVKYPKSGSFTNYWVSVY